jgi:hypothetical protein
MMPDSRPVKPRLELDKFRSCLRRIGMSRQENQIKTNSNNHSSGVEEQGEQGVYTTNADFCFQSWLNYCELGQCVVMITEIIIGYVLTMFEGI